MYCWFTRKCAMKVWITFTHTTGYTYSAYPWHHTPHCLWPTLECGNFNQSIDKASCDAFLSCSTLFDIFCSHQSYYRTDALQSYEIILINHKIEAKYSKTLLKKCFHPKMWYDFREIRNLYKIQLFRRLWEAKLVERRKTTCWVGEVNVLKSQRQHVEILKSTRCVFWKNGMLSNTIM